MSTTLPVVRSNGRLLIAVFLLLPGSVLWAQQDGSVSTEPGVVMADDVYVRSGPSLNHYTICKLGKGARVSVLGEKSGWMEILPPAEAYSLISSDYVDTVDKQSGVVNGNNVRVRAGSLLNKNKYTVQTMVSRGFELQIVGENPDGFFRIKPPAGATLWINKEFVTVGGEVVVTSEPADSLGVASSDEGQSFVASASSAVDVAGHGSGSVTQTKRTATLSSLDTIPTTVQRAELKRIDADAERELGKPIYERDFDSIIQRYRRIATQKGDEFASQYALSRQQQIENFAAVVAGARRMRQLDENAGQRRREFLGTRSSLRSIKIPTPRGLDAKGELQISALYPHGSLPRRYRLVDPAASEPRTLGYVELPPDSPIEVADFLGKYVGVRASFKRLLGDSVNPVPIYVADELVVMQPGALEDVAQDGGAPVGQ